MRQITRKGLMTVAAATGVLAATGGYASADSGAQGSATDSPGVLSGNSVQVPVHAPVNVCGNTVNVVGALNPSVGNTCANKSGGSGSHHDDGHGGGSQSGSGHGAQAGGDAAGSPGVGSGNNVQVPVDVPVNVCGNSVNVGGIGNATTGNECGNGTGGGGHHTPPGGGHENPPGKPGEPGHPEKPEKPEKPGQPGEPGHPGGQTPGGGHTNNPGTQTVTRPEGVGQLAQTGSELPLGLALPAGAGAILGGALLYRKARATP
ncbi:chaplin [Streptomyces bluensis]|uniref:chaplin n=1 Tax=Streptomyces bluensis TaxID=33897 RepID=UPI00369C7E12